MKASEVDAVFHEARRGLSVAKIEQISNSPGVLDVRIFGSSWDEVDHMQNRFSNVVGNVVIARKLKITASSNHSDTYRFRSQYNERLWFLTSVATTILGAAMLILSLRIFGGGQLPQAHAPVASSAA